MTHFLQATTLALIVCLLVAGDALSRGPRGGGGRGGVSRGGGIASGISRGGGGRSPRAAAPEVRSPFAQPGASLGGPRPRDFENLPNQGLGRDKLSSVLSGGKLPQPFGPRAEAADRAHRLQQHLGVSQPTALTPTDLREHVSGRQDAVGENRNQRHDQWQQQSQQVRDNVADYWANQPAPFTAAWYAQHPQAWKITHPHADAWAAAAWGTVVGWLGAVNTQPSAVNYGAATGAVVYSETHDYSSDVEVAAAAAELAESGAAAELTDGQWLPLGVFALVEGERTNATMALQLAVNKQGVIAGNYTNLLAGDSQPLHGAIDKRTQLAAWRINNNTAVQFETSLAGLTEDETPVRVRFADGDSQTWTLVRLQQ